MLCRFGKIAVGAGFTPAQNDETDTHSQNDDTDTHAQNDDADTQNHTNTDNGINAQMILNEYGQIAYDEWVKLSERFPNFTLDVFQIMPNHIHGIIVLNDIAVGAGFTPAQNDETDTPVQNDMNIRAGASPAPTVSDIVGTYKSLVANGCLEIYKSKHIMAGVMPDQIPSFGKLWQRNFHEHIIRDERSYQRISDYIINNPANWAEDKFYSK